MLYFIVRMFASSTRLYNQTNPAQHTYAGVYAPLYTSEGSVLAIVLHRKIGST